MPIGCLTLKKIHPKWKKKANLRDLIAATGQVILLKIGFKSSIFRPMWPWNLMDDPEKQKRTSSILCQALCIISKQLLNSNWSYSPEMLNSCQSWRFFVPCDLGIWWATFKNNRAPLLCYFKLCSSFQSHWWIQTLTGVTVRNHPIRRFFYPCDLKIWQMTLKNNRAPFLCYFKLCASFHSHL